MKLQNGSCQLGSLKTSVIISGFQEAEINTKDENSKTVVVEQEHNWKLIEERIILNCLIQRVMNQI